MFDIVVSLRVYKDRSGELGIRNLEGPHRSPLVFAERESTQWSVHISWKCEANLIMRFRKRRVHIAIVEDSEGQRILQ